MEPLNELREQAVRDWESFLSDEREEGFEKARAERCEKDLEEGRKEG